MPIQGVQVSDLGGVEEYRKTFLAMVNCIRTVLFSMSIDVKLHNDPVQRIHEGLNQPLKLGRKLFVTGIRKTCPSGMGAVMNEKKRPNQSLERKVLVRVEDNFPCM